MTSLELAIQAEDERAEAAEAAREEDFAVLAQLVKAWGAEIIAHELQAICDRQSQGATKFTYGFQNLDAFAFGYDDNSHIAHYEEF